MRPTTHQPSASFGRWWSVGCVCVRTQGLHVLVVHIMCWEFSTTVALSLSWCCIEMGCAHFIHTYMLLINNCIWCYTYGSLHMWTCMGDLSPCMSLHPTATPGSACLWAQMAVDSVIRCVLHDAVTDCQVYWVMFIYTCSAVTGNTCTEPHVLYMTKECQAH